MKHPCTKCKGSGTDWESTERFRKKGLLPTGTIQCSTCNGTGRDEWLYFIELQNHTRFKGEVAS